MTDPFPLRLSDLHCIALNGTNWAAQTLMHDTNHATDGLNLINSGALHFARISLANRRLECTPLQRRCDADGPLAMPSRKSGAFWLGQPIRLRRIIRTAMAFRLVVNFCFPISSRLDAWPILPDPHLGHYCSCRLAAASNFHRAIARARSCNRISDQATCSRCEG